MPINPLDLQNRKWRRAFRGYEAEAVDAFLEKVRREYEELFRENFSLKEKIQDLSLQLEEYRHLERTLRDALVMGQQAAEDYRRSAEKEAALIMREAQAQADLTVARAEAEAHKVHRKVEELKMQARVFHARWLAALRGQVLLWEESLTAGAPGEADLQITGMVAAAGEELDEE